MKKILSIVIVITLVLSTAVLTMGAVNNPLGNPGPSGQNPNQNPGGPEASFDFEGIPVPALKITVTGGGNNLQILAIANGAQEFILRAGNGTFTQSFTIKVGGFTYGGNLSIQGNSLRASTAEHLCQWENFVVPATCIAEGSKGQVCGECKATKDVSVIAINPDNHAAGAFECCGVECTACNDCVCEGEFTGGGNCPGWGVTCGDVCNPCKNGVGSNHTNCRTLLGINHPQYQEFCGCVCP